MKIFYSSKFRHGKKIEDNEDPNTEEETQKEEKELDSEPESGQRDSSE